MREAWRGLRPALSGASRYAMSGIGAGWMVAESGRAEPGATGGREAKPPGRARRYGAAMRYRFGSAYAMT